MKIIWNRRRTTSAMTRRNVSYIASTLLSTNTRAFVATKEDPFLYIRMLEEYGVNAVATPVKRNKKIIGYKFKNAS
jgi:hypothetical protein